MIYKVKGNLFDGLPDCSVVMHQVNCLGVADAGFAKQVRERFSGWYESYSEYCRFSKDNPKELLGRFHQHAVNDRLIICSAFAQVGISKTAVMTDYRAWDTILRRIEKQISEKNRNDRQSWSLHIPYGIGCGLGGGDWEEMKSLFDFYFGESPVKLYIHSLTA